MKGLRFQAQAPQEVSISSLFFKMRLTGECGAWLVGGAWDRRERRVSDQPSLCHWAPKTLANGRQPAFFQPAPPLGDTAQSKSSRMVLALSVSAEFGGRGGGRWGWRAEAPEPEGTQTSFGHIS